MTVGAMLQCSCWLLLQQTPQLLCHCNRDTSLRGLNACSWHFDFTYPPAYLAHTLTNVPMPGHAKQKLPTLPAKSGAAVSTADSSKKTEGKHENKKSK